MIELTQEQLNELSTNLGEAMKRRGMPLRPNKLNELTAEVLGYTDYQTLKGLMERPAYPQAQGFIHAETFTDDHNVEVSFNAAQWFAQASEEMIFDLYEINWGGNYAADAVADYMERFDDEIAGMKSYLDIASPNFNGDAIGYECHVSEEDAMAWLKQYRTEAWAIIVCDKHAIRLTEAQEPELGGMWDWNSDNDACDISFSTQGQAALDAVKQLKIEG